VADEAGRGVFYWEAVDKKYFVNSDTVYQTSYAGSTMSITAGTEKVYFFEIGNYLVILDPENNEGWTINSATPTVIAQITDTDFPSEQTPALQLTRGGTVLNGKLYVGTTDGDIYECAIKDPTAWAALDFRNAEIEPDDGVYIGEHHQHVVAIGTRTCEFFYDAANSTGSTLNPRTDIDYEIGAADRDSFWEESDLLFWVGYTASGGISVYSLQNFVPTKISTPDIDTFLGSAITVDDIQLLGSGFQVGGRIFYVLTLYNLLTTVQPTISLYYELVSNRWYIGDLELLGVDEFPLVDWTKASNTRLGEGILSNGDLITPVDSNAAQDTVGASSVFEDGVFEVGVFSSTAFVGSPIQMEILIGSQDMGMRKYKYQTELWPVGIPTDNTATLNVQWSDESDDNFNTAKPIDVSKPGTRLRRLGKFRQRTYKLTYATAEQYRISGIETVERAGNA